ncbi:MAG: amidohydrolase family protein [Streptosporangiales bacterium]|nr:amidohydrolase family protein [Streptosporangiales bacterium]MBO0891230.1 amidohydrolase family protein [Acidothermales bacterium]
MTLDVHAHCVPVGLIETLERDSGSYGIEITSRDGTRAARIAGRVDTPALRSDLIDVDARIAAMDQARIRTQVLSSWIDLTAYALPADAGARYARMFNEHLAATAALHPDRFLAVCTVPLQSPERAAEELRHAVGRLGMVGVEIATTVDGTELDDPGLDPFWVAAHDLGCIVLVHPYRSLAGRSMKRYFLGNLVGNPAESTLAIAHLVFGGVLERFPDLRICVVHGGGFLPYQWGRLDRGYHAVPRLTAGQLTLPPSKWLRRLYFDTVVHAPEVLRVLVDLVGVEHVVLGSDYPFEMGDPDPVATVEAVPGLDEAGRQLILRGNLDRLFAGVRG